MITSEVLLCTFQIRWQDSIGTAFAFDHNGKQYLVTARHVVEGICNGDSILITHDQQFEEMSTELVGVGEGDVDLAVLKCPILFAQNVRRMGYSDADKISLGQQVYFTGFPFGWHWGTFPGLSSSFPIPFVKTGILSGVFDDPDRLVIDGHANKGFSGGPVVFYPRQHSQEFFHVAGVVSSLPTPAFEPITTKQGDAVLDQDNLPVGFRENPGLFFAVGIKYVIDLINQNPIGHPISNSHSEKLHQPKTTE